MSMGMSRVSVLVLCSLVIAVPSIRADWVQDGVPVCMAIGNQHNPSIVSDGTGGAVVTWPDDRSGSSDIYAQGVKVTGMVQWAADGVALCVAASSQQSPAIASDGAGGTIVTWRDNRSGNNDIYAQRVNGSGVAQWTADGVALCTATGDQWPPIIISDGKGGAIVVWSDHRSGTDYDIYAQRVNASGVPQWTANGVALCTATGDQWSYTTISDGKSGAIVSWEDHRGGTDSDIYAQRVNASGVVQWTSNGVTLCPAFGAQSDPELVSDGVGGAIVAWKDSRGTYDDIYAQRVNSSGAVQWTVDGVALCTATRDQGYATVISDGIGGAIVAWYDYRSENGDIYAQRVNASGAVQWTANGVALCTETGHQQYPKIVSDLASGAIVTWQDLRSGNYDIYVQRVGASGAVQWTAGGVALCAAAGSQEDPVIIPDGAGGAIVTWTDYRNGDPDVYTQCVDAYGRVGMLAPEIYAVRDVPGDQGGKVNLSWYAAHLDILMDRSMSHYSIWRAISSTQAAMAIEAGASALECLSDLDAMSGKSVVRIEHVGGLTYFWELMETVEALYMEAYGKPVATLFDSTAVCDEYHYFQVVAHTTDPKVFWKSEPDSGYSVDNLPPEVPDGLVAEQSYVPAGLAISWNTNPANDLSHYMVYRGSGEDFVPGPENRVSTPTEPEWFDSSWRWNSGYYYKISAVDMHGNESGFALLSPDAVTGSEPSKPPDESFLSQNYPNPFNPVTRIAFGTSAPGHVSLRIYDAAGRLVRVLVDDDRSPGRYEEIWDGRESEGRTLASGIYFYKLSAGSFVETKKMTLMK